MCMNTFKNYIVQRRQNSNSFQVGSAIKIATSTNLWPAFLSAVFSRPEMMNSFLIEMEKR